ncbi:BTAD domain-containing putative transcriptional regulator [Mycobacterium sp. NPDC048908]|uniref:BTAD domain-containing putative transcriptional regulator n=1 Tax=Mycobacterium sp. NPDC048908 TaxID=3364292 RepID=UPI00371F492C
MATEFRLLGDVEARVDGQRLEIGHVRQRCVLVALLVNVNQPVSADQLIDRVWANDPPHKERNALAAYLSRLRHLFADAPDVQIVREPGGYKLTADPLSVDLHQFRHAITQARATAEPVEAAAKFEAGLNLWRGEPFASIDTPWVNDVRTALESERLSAQLDRNDAALRAGRHTELLGELTAAVQTQPLDERLAAQLMLAQYRSGRQADALATFTRVRDRLADELGVDPSPSLREVYQTILVGEPAQKPAPVSRPQSDLPRRTTTFIGRAQEVRRVTAALQDAALVTLTGVGGVGKTRLALETASAATDRYADGVWFCELAPVESGAVSHALAATLRLQQQQGLGVEDTLIEYLRSRELLLVVDNCEHVLDAAAAILDRIARHCATVSVLATSRAALGVEGERLLGVSPLTDAEAAQLFADRAKAGRPDFDLEHEPVGAVAEICRRLDGLPLAIELAAARMRVMSSLDVARRLDGLRLLSGGSRSAHPRQQSLVATIDWSYHLLTGPEQSLFMRLSVFAGGFDLDAAHGVCADSGADEHDTLESLTGLVEKSMVTLRGGTDRSRFGLLETLRAYGRNRLRHNGLGDTYAARHAAYYTELAERAAAGMHTADERGWVERMTPDYDNLRAAYEHALATGDIDLALRLVTSMVELAHLRVGYEASGWAEHLIEVTDSDHPLFAATVGFAARGAWNRGDFARARALATKAHGRNPGRGTGRVGYPGDVLADLALYEGDPHAALRHYEAEAARARGDEDPVRLVWTLFYLAICHAVLRDPAAGLPAAEESVRVADSTANPTARSMARYALGLVLKKSEPERALALFDEAAELAASVQNFWWHGIALMEAAATRAVHGDPATAARLFIDVLDHWDRVGDWSQQWLNLRYVTRLLKRLGAHDDAATLHRALVSAGKASPLRDQQAGGAGLTGAQAVAMALAGLRRFG